MKIYSSEELLVIYNNQANGYSKLANKDKTIDYKWRKKLISLSKGKTLELSVGAGANFKFYPKNIKEIAAVDLSTLMLEKAKEEVRKYMVNIKTTFINASVEEVDFPVGTFDTIISTFSLCAYNNPVQVLNKMSDWCKKDGKVLLLEHGLSKYAPIRWIQRRIDKYQYRKIGCHSDRNIIKLIKKSNLNIIRMERKLFGIIHIIVAEPK